MDEFDETVDKILSARGYHMKAAAGAWAALARAAVNSRDRLESIAGETSQEPGVGLAELADRLGSVGGWGGGAAELALTISRQLSHAGEESDKAAERALSLRKEMEKERDAQSGKAEDASGGDGGNPNLQADKGVAMHEQRMEKLRERAADELKALSEAFAGVKGGSAPPAPEVESGAGAGPSAGAAMPTGGNTATAEGAGGPMVKAANGADIGAGSYPHSSVVGPGNGDFSGWVKSPNTGFLVDPATGREFDPTSGRWIDPVTGKPFGEVTDYATRLSGISGGAGGLTDSTGPGLVATGGAGGGGTSHLAGMYGGTVPPSIANAGPAQHQMTQQAARNLAHRAGVATSFASRESEQGGRPFRPPPGAAAHAVPAVAAAPGGRGPRLFGERPDTWRGRAADAASRHGLTGQPGPSSGATAASRREGEENRRPNSAASTEDPSVWRAERQAGTGVLGE